jgi:hypothetical protein
VAASSAEPAPLVTVRVTNPSEHAIADAPVTFGQAFRRGDVPAGKEVRCVVGDRSAQVDAKCRYDDGSLRFAVVSIVLPELAAGQSQAISLASARPSPPETLPVVTLEELLKTDFDAAVTLRFPDGTVKSADARKLLSAPDVPPATWLRGHAATEWLVAAAPVDADGTPDEDLHVRFAVRAYAGSKHVRVSVTLENCWDTWAGTIRYDAAIRVGGREVFSQKGVDHRPLSRWRKVFWWPGGPEEPPLDVAHDFAYLASTGAIPNYDSAVQLAPLSPEQERILADQPERFRIMERGSLTAYMPTTGGRPEIAPYPCWTVRYLLTQDGRARHLVLANGELAGSWPIHVRARATGRIMTIDERPEFWLDGRGSDRPQWKPPRAEPDPGQTRLTPDLAHQGSLAFVPYLVTGDHYFLEEACFWANYCLLATWPEPRRKAEGILSGQIRGDAWALRNVADAAWIASEGDPEAAYFDEKIRNNVADRIRRMYGPPEYNKLGFWGLRTVTDARIHGAANPDWMVIAPWEHDYLMWSLHHLVELGWGEAARPRDFLLRWRVGTLASEPDFDCRLAAPYRFVVGERTRDGSVLFYADWTTLSRENSRLTNPDETNAGNDYLYSARAAVVCGLDGGFPNAEQALDTISRRFADLEGLMARNPAWMIRPREH